MLALMLILYLVIGALAGLLAGLFGIGGGIIVVPALAYIFHLQGFPDSVLMQYAVGTSIVTIVGTSISSVWTHNRHRTIHWSLVRSISLTLVIGSIIGVQIAHAVSTETLTVIFVIFIWVMAIRMGLMKKSVEQQIRSASKLLLNGVAILIGVLSGLVGVGGGTLLVPFFTYLNLNMRQAVATSAGCALVIAVAGSISNIFVVNQQVSVHLPWSTGYIYWPAVVLIVIASVLSARVGANLVQKIPTELLRRLFAIFLCIMGIYMLYSALFNST